MEMSPVYRWTWQRQLREQGAGRLAKEVNCEVEWGRATRIDLVNEAGDEKRGVRSE